MDKTTLGGFEAILDGFIPNPNGGFRNSTVENNTDEFDSIDDDELEDIKKNNIEVKNKEDNTTKQEQEDIEEKEEELEDEPKRKPGRPKKEIEIDTNTIDNEGDEVNAVTDFFDAMAEELGWEFDEEDEKPKDVSSLISYFRGVIEENSKPEYSSEEVEKLDNFVKQGGDIKKYLTIEAEIDLDDIDMDDESNQKIIVKQFLKEKGFSAKRIEKQIDKYEEAGLLEDEAQDALEDLKEIKEQKKEQLLKELEKAYQAQVQRQQLFYLNVVDEIKGLKNIRGITVPEKDKKVLMDYILKPDTDGKTKYQKDYAKGGVKNLIESAYFTMNADKLIEAAKREGNNSAVDKLRRSLKSNGINTKSRQQSRNSDDEPIWFSAARQLRIS